MLSIALSLIALTSSSTAVAADERELQSRSILCLANLASGSASGGSIESCCANADASDNLCPALICTDFSTISIRDGCQCSSLGNLCADASITGTLNAFVPGEEVDIQMDLRITRRKVDSLFYPPSFAGIGEMCVGVGGCCTSDTDNDTFKQCFDTYRADNGIELPDVSGLLAGTGGGDTPDASTNDEIPAEPTTNDEVVEPATNDEVVEPATNDEVVEPATNDEVVEPATNDEVVEPATNDEVVEPATNDEVAEPATDNPEPLEEPAAPSSAKSLGISSALGLLLYSTAFLLL
ncbi:hypothetical protein THAOC_14804 [Thalassiosira oceanica]|uniref:Uncharacterized protein n=1 Tax=Thalassiosira oceanica TaxID=159749 RepID=K0T1U4_THAOC|nr:hypothetical protein THAOC_14804 [Thalassiosira oceanica]|eukprot:EJK64457.1 hypothetical protein THAOC_14804 [Thalassiosira oceanica]